MKLPCAVVRDLLPLYAEKLTEDETKKLVDEHLEDCAECRQKLSEIDTGFSPTVESAEPLIALKKEIRKRRWYVAVIAALCVFVAVYTWFYHVNEWELVPWEDGLIEVTGTEERPYDELYDPEVSPGEPRSATAEALIIRVDSRINGTHETVFKDDDGTETVLLQGWTSKGRGTFVRDYNEMALCPIPDRLIYDGGAQQQLLWGKPLNGGVETLPRLALGYYVILAMAFAVLSGILWFVLRNRERSWIVRQVFFAPVSYLTAHFLIKGYHTVSDFFGHDLIGILLLTAALYALFSLAWQVFLQQRKER